MVNDLAWILRRVLIRHGTMGDAAYETRVDDMVDMAERRPQAGPLQRSYAFGGAFYAWPFHCGVAAFVQEHCALHAGARIFGTSSGALAASLLACDVNVRAAGVQAALRSTDAHIGRVGPYLRPAAIRASLQLFMEALPPDAHERATNRLVLTLTQVPSFTPRKVTYFKNREALFDGLVGTMAVPGHAVALAYRAQALGMGWVLDGGLRGTPVLDRRVGWDTVRVATFSESDRVPKNFRAADVQPRWRVPLRMRFLVANTSMRMRWFEHGYQRAMAHFAERDRTSDTQDLGELSFAIANHASAPLPVT